MSEAALDLVSTVAAIREHAAPGGLGALADELILRGVDVDEARARIDAARWSELRAMFEVTKGDER